uniref:Uncharacterized protein n=1 Tax=Trichogramma kaykai TaxID=54128 RepID=A0ABD2WAQ7_9HYME
MTFEDTIEVEQGSNDRVQNRIIYEDNDESVEDNAVSEYIEHIYEDHWETEAPDYFNGITEKSKRAGEIVMRPSILTIFYVFRPVPEHRYNLLFTPTK